MKERLNARIITTGLALTVAGLALSGCSETSDSTFVVGVECPSETEVVIGNITNYGGDRFNPGGARLEVGCAQEGANPTVAPRNIEILNGPNVVEVNDPRDEALTRIELEVSYDSSGFDWDHSYTEDPNISVINDQVGETRLTEITIDEIQELQRVEIVS